MARISVLEGLVKESSKSGEELIVAHARISELEERGKVVEAECRVYWGREKEFEVNVENKATHKTKNNAPIEPASMIHIINPYRGGSAGRC
jgi:hypothetical protein